MTTQIVKNGKKLQVCSRCIYDETIPGISFDEEGVCNYCRTMEELQEKYKTGTAEGKAALKKIIRQIKKDGQGKKYDCIIGVSGGTDSSYLLVKLKEWGLRPLAVHYDNTWNTAIATENMKKLLDALNVDLYTYVVDSREIDDIFKAFILARVPELDASTDMALLEVMYRAAAKYKVKYIIEGHSYKTEGISPLSSYYFDGMYVKDVHRKYGKLPMKTYPLMTFWRFMKWTFLYRIKRIRPFWYIDYSKKSAVKYLQKKFNWEYYGGHHLENRIVAFYMSYYLYRKFHEDKRYLSLAAGVRSGIINRNDAIQEYFYTEPQIEDGLVEYVEERLGFSHEDMEKIIHSKNRNYKEFRTYKKYFQMLRPLFRWGVKANLIAESFYIKYTSKD